MEWSKYSCVHQGAHAHAQQAQQLSFKPFSCNLPESVDRDDRVFPAGRRIVFAGDSLTFGLNSCRFADSSSSLFFFDDQAGDLGLQVGFVDGQQVDFFLELGNTFDQNGFEPLLVRDRSVYLGYLPLCL